VYLIFAAYFFLLVGHRFAGLLPVRRLAVRAVAVALGVLHALIRTVEVHDIHGVVREDFVHQSLDDIAHRRIQTALVILRESVVLRGHRLAAGELLAPAGKAGIF
jgi:hypothetical protein